MGQECRLCLITASFIYRSVKDQRKRKKKNPALSNFRSYLPKITVAVELTLWCHKNALKLMQNGYVKHEQTTLNTICDNTFSIFLDYYLFLKY